MVRLSLGGKDVFVQGGGKFSYLINNERIYTGDYNTSTPNDLNHLLQWDAGAIGGVGYWLGNHVVIDARYYYGMAPLIKKHTVLDPVTLEPIFYGADKLYNRVWSLNLTFYL